MEIKMNESFEINDILTWKDREKFDEYLGVEGYFADTLDNLAWNIHKGRCYRVDEFDYTCTLCFKPTDSDKYFSMFLPEDKVRIPEPEVKTRPFRSMEEFMEDTGLKVGDTIYLRNTNPDDSYVIRLITGLNNDAVILGHIPMNFTTLFKNQMFSTDGHSWRGFVHVIQDEISPKVLSKAKRLIKNNMYKGDDPKIDTIHDGIKGYFFDDCEPDDILNTILNNPETLKSWQYGYLCRIHGELVRCVTNNGEEFYYNYFIPESVVEEVKELCQKIGE